MERTDDILKIKGIGEKNASLYRKLGMETVEDVIYYFPRDYVFYENEKSVLNNYDNDIISIRATVANRPMLRSVRNFKIVTAKLMCDDTLISATWFNMPFLTKTLTAGKEYIFRGILTAKSDHYHFEQPQIFTIEQYERLRDSFWPIYSLTKGLSNNSITKSVEYALDKCELTQEPIFKLHFPKTRNEMLEARKIFVYEEFLVFILKLRLLKQNNEKANNNFNIIPVAQTRRLIEKLPYKLTNAQKKVFEEVENDICSSHSMNRLIQGDVGCGKTIISMLACITVGINGYQAAVMVPTEILAVQHYENFCEMFKKYGIDLKVALLTGSLTAKNKKEIYSKIENHEVDIIIGTHALIQEKVAYANLALVVTDEQHRFGVNQRRELSKKSQQENVHVLVMSATPIPRTLAIILYGDLDISIIDEVPARRLPIKNCVVGRDYRKSAYDFMKKQVLEGRQVYVICPLVEESEAIDAVDAVSYAEKLMSVFGDEITIGCLTGKMKPSIKNKVMDDFSKGNIDILVSTTVVEVGVNVPNATVMLIEDADRFGLAQLHQLRGRIGRGDYQSYCIFMSGKNNPKNIERLNVLNKSNDGFYIASQDLKLRGPGDFFGVRQSGDMRFKLADVYTDADILKKASEDADRILLEDPTLSKPENEAIRKKVDKMSNALDGYDI